MRDSPSQAIPPITQGGQVASCLTRASEDWLLCTSSESDPLSRRGGALLTSMLKSLGHFIESQRSGAVR
jgi:hypothetical protein